MPKGYNGDEAKVPAYVMLDPLKRDDGSVVTTRAQWGARRAEILRAFEENVFGKTPEAAKKFKPKYAVVEKDAPALDGLALRTQVDIALAKAADAPVMHLLLYLPAKAKGPSPVVLGLNFAGNASVVDDPGIRATELWKPSAKRGELPTRVAFDEKRRGWQTQEWQVRMLLEHGYGLATVYYGDIEPDARDAVQLSVRQFYFAKGQTQTQAKADAWGALGAWAWGLSKAADYLRSLKMVDAKEIAVTGHSRLGKAADWAAAQDERFAAVLSTESGKGGQSLYRREFGETIGHLEGSFPYWFCANYAQWVGKDREIPVDGNLLLALIAPRPLYVASAEGDLWSDPRGEFLSAVDVGRVYALFGKRGLGTDAMPAVNEPVMGDLAYHVRSGKHDVTVFDWEQYVRFLDKEFGSPLSRGAR